MVVVVLVHKVVGVVAVLLRKLEISELGVASEEMAEEPELVVLVEESVVHVSDVVDEGAVLVTELEGIVDVALGVELALVVELALFVEDVES